jgi:glycosyltransferase involved in cell wall biosynthesis
MIKREQQLVETVEHSFFVSRPLAEKAVTKYNVSRSAVTVSPNATETAFLNPVPDTRICRLLDQHPGLKRPLVGVIGGVNDRLDFELLLRCANLTEVGSLVFVGGIDPSCEDADLRRLQDHKKVLFVGQQPHDDLPAWMQALDVALIPYRPTPLNHACSPMRLFDHLAAGRPMVATRACDQVRDYHEWVKVSDNPVDFVENLKEAIADRDHSPEKMRTFVEQSQRWSQRAEAMARTMGLQATQSRGTDAHSTSSPG